MAFVNSGQLVGKTTGSGILQQGLLDRQRQDELDRQQQAELDRYRQTYAQGQQVGRSSGGGVYGTAEEAYTGATGRQVPQGDTASRASAVGGGNTGSGNIGQSAYEREKFAQLESRLQREEAMRREGVFSGLFRQASESTTPRASLDPILADETAARGAAFARAKEMAAQTARASLSSLEDVSAERGLMGSTIEAGEQGRAIGGARADINDFLREELMSDTKRAENVRNLRYQGDITQRGQDLSRQQSLLGLLAGSRLY